jgi:hypothetical protein
VKHAGSHALDRIEKLLQRIRGRKGLIERKRGVFYRGSRAFLHFHEDPAGIFADVRLGEEFERLPATCPSDWRVLLAHIDSALAE